MTRSSARSTWPLPEWADYFAFQHHTSGYAVTPGQPFCRCLTSATETGISVFKMMEVSQQKSVDTLHAYVRRSDLFKDTRAQRQSGS